MTINGDNKCGGNWTGKQDNAGLFSIVFPSGNELPHDKTNKMACVPSEDSDQPRHLPSDQSLRCSPEKALGPSLPIELTVRTDQTGRMPRLIWVFAGRTCHFVGFVMRQLNLCVVSKTFPYRPILFIIRDRNLWLHLKMLFPNEDPSPTIIPDFLLP